MHTRAAPLRMLAQPWSKPFMYPELLEHECGKLDRWEAGTVNRVAAICQFMAFLGGCTTEGQVYWRTEMKHVASILLDGLLDQSPAGSRRQVLMGCAGVGKSALVCLLAFHLVVSHTKNVLLYRKSSVGDGNYLLMHHTKDHICYAALESCDHKTAAAMYEGVKGTLGPDNVWLVLDGFEYSDAPLGMDAFRLLATSEHIRSARRSQDEGSTVFCLLPSWLKPDVFAFGAALFDATVSEMNKRFFFSGGSIGLFTTATVETTRKLMQKLVDMIEDPFALFVSWGQNAFSTRLLSRKFVRDTNDRDAYTQQPPVFIVRTILPSLGLRLTRQLFTWASSVGHTSLARCVYPVYGQRLLEAKGLLLSTTEYVVPRKRSSVDEKPMAHVPLKVETAARCTSGTEIASWRDSPDRGPLILEAKENSLVHGVARLDSDGGGVAFLHFSLGGAVNIKLADLKQIIARIGPAYTPAAQRTEQEDGTLPLLIIVCPDCAACRDAVITPAVHITSIRKLCRLQVGYASESPSIAQSEPVSLHTLEEVARHIGIS